MFFNPGAVSDYVPIIPIRQEAHSIFSTSPHLMLALFARKEATYCPVSSPHLIPDCFIRCWITFYR